MKDINHYQQFYAHKIIVGITLTLVFCIVGCAGMKTKKIDEEEQRLIELKKGKLKGPVYFNEYYKFQITSPRGWHAIRSKTESLVKMKPKDEKFEIEVSVAEGSNDKEGYLKSVIKDGNYELISKENDTFMDQPVLIAYLRSTVDVVNRKVKSMFISQNNNVYYLMASGPVDEFSQYERSYEEAFNSFRFTDSLIESLGEYDVFTYEVQPGDSLKGLATRFLNDPAEAVTISHFNQISTLLPEREIDIPRYRIYRVQEGDTELTISKKIYNDPLLFHLIPPYNSHLSKEQLLTPGTEIKVPMYFLYTVQPGDTVPALALKYLRSEDRYKLIILYNNKPRQITVGSIIKIPILWAERDYIVYVVKRNDSLSSIAEEYTGSINNFPLIAEFNNIHPPFEISIGQAIKIPKDMIVIKPKTSIKKPPKSTEEEEGKEEGEKEFEIEDEIEGPIYEPE